jgi:hypothetical protein
MCKSCRICFVGHLRASDDERMMLLVAIDHWSISVLLVKAAGVFGNALGGGFKTSRSVAERCRRPAISRCVGNLPATIAEDCDDMPNKSARLWMNQERTTVAVIEEHVHPAGCVIKASSGTPTATVTDSRQPGLPGCRCSNWHRPLLRRQRHRSNTAL